jgi:formate-dependent nitrite reductase membrane component NrfD
VADRTAAHSEPRDAYRDVPILAPPTWNHEIAAYFFCGGVSAGATVLGSLAELLGGPRLRSLARTARVVALVALVPCPPLLIDDLGRPALFPHMLRIFKPSSPMNLGSWALSVHGALATLGVAGVRWPVSAGVARLLAALDIAPALVMGGYTGVLLGTTSVPVWSESPLLGGLFMASAMSSGCAATSLAGTVADCLSAEADHALATIGRSSSLVELGLTVGYLVTSGPARTPLVRGEGAVLTGLSVGLLLMGLMLERARTARHRKLAGSLATLAAGAALRWAIVRAGRVSSRDRETLLALQES